MTNQPAVGFLRRNERSDTWGSSNKKREKTGKGKTKWERSYCSFSLLGLTLMKSKLTAEVIAGHMLPLYSPTLSLLLSVSLSKPPAPPPPPPFPLHLHLISVSPNDFLLSFCTLSHHNDAVMKRHTENHTPPICWLFLLSDHRSEALHPVLRHEILELTRCSPL